MSKASEAVKTWRKRSKGKLVAGFGGKCGICGYSKTTNALELHHINPNEKEFGFGAIRANCRNWENIVKEAKKCIMVCSNCHREIHDDLIPISIINMAPRFDESKCQHIQLGLTTYNCVCGNIKKQQSKYCSNECYVKNENNFLKNINMDIVEFNIVAKTLTLSQMSLKFGVSVTTIKNWKNKAKNINVEI